jgi:Asp-tRNA(Asn)/Glu-tRNA(Gln) amidotransferase A subunit family amidase
MNEHGKNTGYPFGADPQSQITYLTEQNRNLTLLTNELKNKLTEVMEQLRRSENARQTEAARLGDTLMQAQNIKFEIEKLAREEAKKVVDNAKAEAERIIASIKFRDAEIRKQLDDEFARMIQVGQEILKASSASQQSTQAAFGKIDDEIRSFINHISEQRAVAIPDTLSAPPKKSDYATISKILDERGIPSPQYPTHSHNVFGKDE